MYSYTMILYITIGSGGFGKITWHRKRPQYNGKKARYQNSYMHKNITYVYKCVSTTQHTNFIYSDRHRKNTGRNTLKC